MKKIFIISDLGTNIGLGHYSRSLVLTKEIKYYLKNKTKIFNYYFHWKNSQNLGFRTVSNKKLNQLHQFMKLNSGLLKSGRFSHIK